MKRTKQRFQYGIAREARISKRFKSPLLQWLKPFKKKPTPAQLIAESRRRGSSLYGLIEPNDRRAAAAHRYERAQYILRHIEVIRIDVITSEAITQPVRAFIPIRIRRHGRIAPEDYISSARIFADKSLSQSVVKRAEADFLAWLERYRSHADFFEVFAPVVEAFEKVKARLKLVA